jgi:hypothetical protein
MPDRLVRGESVDGLAELGPISFGDLECISKNTIELGIGFGSSLRKACLFTFDGLSIIHELLLGEAMTQLVVTMNLPLLFDRKNGEEL